MGLFSNSYEIEVREPICDFCDFERFGFGCIVYDEANGYGDAFTAPQIPRHNSIRKITVKPVSWMIPWFPQQGLNLTSIHSDMERRCHGLQTAIVFCVSVT